MSSDLYKLAKSLNIPIYRDIECEQIWNYDDYSNQIEEALSFHCNKDFVSQYFKEQISQLIHQGYLLIHDKPIAVPVRTIYEVMENISEGKKEKKSLRNINNNVNFDVLHVHFGQSSFIIENWANYIKRNSVDLNFTHESAYKSLMLSLSKKDKTGEWIVYSKDKGKIKFWCIWLHNAGDDNLIEIIKSQL